MATYDIDLTGQITDAGEGPCYCGEGGNYWFSPVFTFPPGDTIDFGHVDVQSFFAGITPDAGPFQPYVFVQGGVGASFDPAAQTDFDLYGHIPVGLSAYCPFIQTDPYNPFDGGYDPACVTAANAGSVVSADLLFTTPTGSIQVGWLGPYDYTPPLATPLPGSFWLMATIFVAAWVRWKHAKA